jgi:hypothetical protein
MPKPSVSVSVRSRVAYPSRCLSENTSMLLVQVPEAEQILCPPCGCSPDLHLAALCTSDGCCLYPVYK